VTYPIYYGLDKKGQSPVRDYILNLTGSEKAKIFAYLRYLSEQGPGMRRPMADYLGTKLGLYELRPSRHRILYFYFEKGNIILLHAFLKKSDQIPIRDIDIALKRKRIFEQLKSKEEVEF
jgi:phage-related protein